MIEAEEARLKAEIDSIVTKINTTMQKIESIVPKDQPSGESNSDNFTDGSPQSP